MSDAAKIVVVQEAAPPAFPDLPEEDAAAKLSGLPGEERGPLRRYSPFNPSFELPPVPGAPVSPYEDFFKEIEHERGAFYAHYHLAQDLFRRGELEAEIPIRPDDSPRPLWQQLTRAHKREFEPLENRAREARILLEWTLRRLRGRKAHAIPNAPHKLQGGLYHVPGEEPTGWIASELGLPESILDVYCRRASGLSARQWWDVLRAEDAVKESKERIRSALTGCFTPDKRVPSLNEAWTQLRRARRNAGSDAASRAWRMGFLNPARLNRAVFVATGRTLKEHEADEVRAIWEEWQAEAQERTACREFAKSDEGTPRSHGGTENGKQEGNKDKMSEKEGGNVTGAPQKALHASENAPLLAKAPLLAAE